MTDLIRLPDRQAETCLICEKPGPGLDKAHVQPRSLAPERVEDPENQVLLCRRCHDNIDKLKIWDHFLAPDGYDVVIVATGEILRHVSDLRVDERLGCLVPGEVGQILPALSATAPAPVDAFNILHTLELPALSEAQLALLFTAFDGWGALAFLAKAEACYGIRERYLRFGEESWRKQAAALTGKKPSTVYLYAEVWAQLLELRAEDYPAFENALNLHWGSLQVAVQTNKEQRSDAVRALIDAQANSTDEVKPAEARKLLQSEGFLPTPEPQVRHGLSFAMFREHGEEECDDCQQAWDYLVETACEDTLRRLSKEIE